MADLYPLVELVRPEAGSRGHQVKQVRGPVPKEMAGDGKGGDCEPHWQWPLEFYYGGEVIEENRTTQDTLRVALYKQGSDEKQDKLVGDTGKFPLRYLVDGRKRATVHLNLTSFSLLTGIINVEVQ